MSELVRINKYLVSCGLGSRRKVEELINIGKIKVNGKITYDLTTQINPDTDEVMFNNSKLKQQERLVYVLMNKPKGYITTKSDEQNRTTVMDIIPSKYKRLGVFPVGRLDKDTEGLLLFTNDGELANHLMHPRYQVPKTYEVRISRPLFVKDRIAIERGIMLDGEKTRPAKIVMLDESNKYLHMTIAEGKKRQIRLTFQSMEYYVKKLKRITLGPLSIGSLPTGEVRLLRSGEVKALKEYLGLTETKESAK